MPQSAGSYFLCSLQTHYRHSKPELVQGIRRVKKKNGGFFNDVV